MTRWTDNGDPNSTAASRTASMTMQHTLTLATFLAAEEEAAISIATYGTPDHNIWIAMGSSGGRVTVYSLNPDGSIKQVASLSAPLSEGQSTLGPGGRRHTIPYDATAVAARVNSITSGTSAILNGKSWYGRPSLAYDGAVPPFFLIFKPLPSLQPQLFRFPSQSDKHGQGLTGLEFLAMPGSNDLCNAK